LNAQITELTKSSLPRIYRKPPRRSDAVRIPEGRFRNSTSFGNFALLALGAVTRRNFEQRWNPFPLTQPE
jgi:hypothetical protein